MKKIFGFLIAVLCLPTIHYAQISEKMRDAYEISTKMVNDRLTREDKENEALLRDIKKEDLVVVDGTYDHIDQVLEALKMPYMRVSQNELSEIKLDPSQTVFINCASSFPVEATRQLATFVNQGGQLITTDWALLNVLEVGFPGYVAYNQKATGDEVVSIEVMDKKDPIINGFIDEEVRPVWWLEGSSYPIKILDKKNVNVLIRSKQLGVKYGEEAVIVSFKYGKGIVYHMISHFYLQRTETRDEKQGTSSINYIKTKSLSKEAVKDLESDDKMKKLNYGEVQSANTSAEFIQRGVLEQKRRSANLKKEEK